MFSSEVVHLNFFPYVPKVNRSNAICKPKTVEGDRFKHSAHFYFLRKNIRKLMLIEKARKC